MKKLFWSLAFALVWVVGQPITAYAQGGGGTVINAASCNNTSVNPDIQNALNSISGAGAFKIVLPAGTCSFSQALSYPTANPITIVGATTCTAGCAAGSQGVGLSFNDQTNITMTAQFTLSGCSATNFCNVSGITIIPNLSTDNGVFAIFGTFPQISLRMFDMHSANTALTSGVIFKICCGYGLIDHVRWDSSAAGGAPTPLNVYGDGPSLGYANWAAASPWGTNNAIFVEDSLTNYVFNGNEGFADNYEGCSIVFRYSSFTNTMPGGWHGTDSSVNRGCVQGEYYNLNVTNTTSTSQSIGAIRSGTVLVHDNIFTKSGSGNIQQMPLQYLRVTEAGTAEQGNWGAGNALLNWTPIGVLAGGSCRGQDCRVVNTLNAADWQVSHTYNFGDVIGPTSNNSGNQNFQQTTTGTCTSGGFRPTFPTLPFLGNPNVADGTCNWNNVGAIITPSVNAGASSGFCSNHPDTAAANNAACPGGTATRFFDANGGVIPFRDQPCYGHDQVSQPCYAWNNSGSGFISPMFQSVFPVTSGVDWFSTAAPGYTPYTYPHPLQGGTLTLTPSNFMFADTGIGDASSDSPKTFMLANNSNSTVTILSISITGADPGDFSDTTPPTTCGPSLLNGATCQIYVTFTPTAIGSRAAALNVSDSDPSSPQTSTLNGMGVFESLAPDEVTFGNQVINTTSPTTKITFTYSGSGSLTLDTLSPSANFSISKSASGACNLTGMTTLLMNHSCSFLVAFGPGSTLGPISGNVTLSFTDTGDSNTTLVLPLNGVGTEVSLSLNPMPFGTVLTGTKVLHETITNKGTTPLTFSPAPTISGTGSGQFSILAYKASPPTSTCLSGTPIAQNATCTLTVQFNSTSSGTTYLETLNINDNGGGSPQTVTITAKD
jgi:hypothetical protein